MNKDNIFKKILRLFNLGQQPSRSEATAQHNGSMVSKLFQMVEDTDEVEIACDEVFELLDQYVELQARGEDVASLFPLVKKHLDRCRDCHEEYEALVRIFEATAT